MCCVFQSILDNVKGQMCCLPVVVSTWFCSYIYTIDDEHRKKPLNMLSQLSKPVQPDSSNQYYQERCDCIHLSTVPCFLIVMILEVLSAGIGSNHHCGGSGVMGCVRQS